MAKNNTSRRFSGGGARPDNREYRQTEATARNEAWSKLSIAQQLQSLDSRLGAGVGARRQRARLLAKQSGPSQKEAREEKTSVQPENTKLKAKERHAQERKERPNK